MEGETMESESGFRERKEMAENPPTNDCCPICFEDFNFPCRTNCNHWFCANCILDYWQYGVALRPCKCPLCSTRINRLTPQTSLHRCQEPKAAEAMKSINQYNRLFVGGVQGLLVRSREFPRLMKRQLLDMIDPDRYDYYRNRVPLVTLLLSMLLMDVIPSPSDSIKLPQFIEIGSYVLFMIIHLVGLYRRRRFLQRVREFAANHP